MADACCRPSGSPLWMPDRRDGAHRRPAPCDRLALDVPAGPPSRGRAAGICPLTCGSRTRRRDGRAIVYAGIQADPLVARVAGLLADATPADRVLARAVMNGERTDPATWRDDVPGTLFAPTRRPEQREHAERLLGACLEVAERGEQSRSQFRGAIVEELTARLLARRVPPDIGPSRAPRAVRRRPGRDPPVRRHRGAAGTSGGLRLQVGCPRDQRRRAAPARRRPTPRRRRGCESSSWRSWCSIRGDRPRCAWRARRRRGPRRACSRIESVGSPRGKSGSDRGARR